MPFMPLDPEVLYRDEVDITKADLRAKAAEVDARIGGNLPDDYSDLDDGEVICLGDGNTGPAPASEVTGPVRFAGKELSDFSPNGTRIDGALVLNGKDHSGRMLVKSLAGGSVLSIDYNADREIGVNQWFSCAIWRQLDGGEVQVISSMANDHPSGHTRVQAGGVAIIIVDVENNVWRLVGETEV